MNCITRFRSRPKLSYDQTILTEMISEQIFQKAIISDRTLQTNLSSDQIFQTKVTSDQRLYLNTHETLSIVIICAFQKTDVSSRKFNEVNSKSILFFFETEDFKEFLNWKICFPVLMFAGTIDEVWQLFYDNRSNFRLLLRFIKGSTTS